MRYRRVRRQRGFTLVEMIVATVLLAFGVVSALMCIGQSATTAGLAGNYTTASLLASQKFAELEAQPDQITSSEQQGDFGDMYQGYSWTLTTEPTDFTYLVKVTLTIEWSAVTKKQTADFVTYEPTQSQTDTSVQATQ